MTGSPVRDRVNASVIRPRFLLTALAIAGGVYLAPWFCGGDRTPDAAVSTLYLQDGGKDAAMAARRRVALDAAVYALRTHDRTLRTAYRPNPTLTPGAARPLTREQVCSTKWSLDRRHVTLAMKKRVAAAYGIPWSEHSKFEFDHNIPRELGGADVDENIWMQPWTGQWNAHDKDRLENQLRRLVCAGQITLAFAQESIASDWIASYRLYVTDK